MAADSTQETGERIPISHLLTCPKCGTSNAPGNRHCSNCGASLAGATTASVTEPAKKGGFFQKLFSKRH